MIIDRNSPVPQYFQLQTWLGDQIERGIFRPDDRIPTEEELCRITGLARATVRQAVQNLVNMGYLVRKRRLGTFVLHRDRPESANSMIGVLVPDIRRGYAPELARGAGDEAVISRHSIILCNTDDLPDKADAHAVRLLESGVGGVVFIPTAATDEKNGRIIEKFIKRSIPVVLADRSIRGNPVDLVTTDNDRGGYRLTRYLLEKGHRYIGVILSTLFSTERDRLRGYERAMEEAGISLDARLVCTNQKPFTEKTAREMARSLITRNKNLTAIFAGHDRIALEIFSVARQLGVRVPDDISLVGYDDLPLADTPSHSLTTMHQPIYEMGRESMRRILARMDGDRQIPRQIVLESQLIERGSVKSVRSD
jgi:DNA-binding LacI/PurR family transcriptional regulator